MPEAVLFVDDEEHILNAVERLFVDSDIRILKAINGEDAIKLMKSQDVAVLVSDNMMPGMKGTTLLSKAKGISPDTVRILMTAYADLPTAIDAINRCEVFRFVVKPWENDVLIKVVEDSINRYKLIHSLREADEATLLSLAQTIELKDPYTRGHCDRVAGYALMIADALDLPEETKVQIKYGSWLHDCGKIGVPEEILRNGGSLNEEEWEIIKNHPVWGADVARQAHLSEVVVNIILYHHERYDGKGYPSGIKDKDIPLEARIVAVADTYDALTTDRPYSKAYSMEKAIDILESMKGENLDPEVMEVFLSLLKVSERPVVR
ncbi:MAG: HD domain-containing protein [Deltaproteobacteria bacterium]|nr:HD domain-containing protein [Deltaproteobacteria bacterium]